MLDGGDVENIVIEDITIERAWSPIFLRLEDRGRVRPGDLKPAPGNLRRCAMTRISGHDCGPRGSYLLSVPEKPIEDILLADIHITQTASRKPVTDESAIPDLRGVYPDAHMIDAIGDAPASALWARHVHGLTLSDYHITTADDPRPAYVLKTDVRVEGIMD